MLLKSNFIMEISASVMYAQIVGFFFAFVSSVGVVVTCTWNQWSIISSSESTSLLNSIGGFNGIWIQCMQYTTGQYQCDDYQTAVFNLPTYMNTIRGFMCLAIIAVVFGCFLALLGMQCTRLLDTMPNKKRVLMLLTAALFIFAGTLTVASIAWFSVITMQNFFLQSDNAIKYTLGDAIWLGVATTISCIITASIFICYAGPRTDRGTFTPIPMQPYRPPMRSNFDTKINSPLVVSSTKKSSQYV